MKTNMYRIAALFILLGGCGDPAPLEKKDPVKDAGTSSADASAPVPDAMPIGGMPMGGIMTAGAAGEPLPQAGMPIVGGDNAGGTPSVGGSPQPTGGMPAGGAMPGGGPSMVNNEPPCQVLHSEENPLSEAPGTSRSALVYDGGPLHFVWADSNGVHACMIGLDGEFLGPREHVDEPEYEVEFVTSLRVNGVAWVAFGAADQPIRIFQAHRPAETLVALATPGESIVGKPILADAIGDLMVVGKTPDGALAWHVISNDLGADSIFVRTTTFGDRLPTSTGAMAGGVLLRLEDVGQCLYLTSPEWTASANLDCYFYQGELLTDGSRSLLWTKETTDFGTRIRLRDLFDPDNSLSIGKFFGESPYLTSQIFRGHKPVISERIITTPEQRLGDLQLVLATHNDWWESRITWGEAGWPYASTAAAIGFMDLPELAREGECVDTDPPTACSSDADCANKSTICSGAAEARQALVIEMGTSVAPNIVKIPMIRRTLLTQGILFDQNPECVPTPEVCDRKDQDCDSNKVADNGLCCTQTSEGPDGQITPLVLEQDFATDQPAVQFLFGERTDNTGTHYIAYRYLDGDTSRWKAMRVSYPNDNTISFGGQGVFWLNNEKHDDYCVTAGCTELIDCNGSPTQSVEGYQSGCKNISKQTLRNYAFNLEAGEGHSLTVLGGLVALIARITDAGDNQGRWGLKWIHYDRNVKPRNDTSPMIPLPAECENILAVAPLKRGPDEESIVVVCPDRILRYYANASRVGEVMLDADGEPRLNYNSKVVRAYPEPNQTNFINCENVAYGNDPQTCDEACGLARQSCVATHLACPNCPAPIELPDAPYRFPDEEWRFSDALLGGFNQILWATVQHGVEQGSVVEFFDLFVAVPSPGQVILRAYRFRAEQNVPEIIEAPSGPTRGIADFADPVFYQEKYPINRVGPPIRIKQGENQAQAHFVFIEGGQAENEQEYVSREVLTGPNIDAIQFAQFQNARGDGGILITSEPIGGQGELAGRAYYALSTQDSLGRINLWSLAPIFTDERPVSAWYLSQAVGAQYRLLQISKRETNEGVDDGRLWTFSAIKTRCTESSN